MRTRARLSGRRLGLLVAVLVLALTIAGWRGRRSPVAPMAPAAPPPAARTAPAVGLPLAPAAPRPLHASDLPPPPPTLANIRCMLAGAPDGARYDLTAWMEGHARPMQGKLADGAANLEVTTATGAARMKVAGFEEVPFRWSGDACVVEEALRPVEFVVEGAVAGLRPGWPYVHAWGCGASGAPVDPATGAFHLEAVADAPGCEVEISAGDGHMILRTAPQVAEEGIPLAFDLAPVHVRAMQTGDDGFTRLYGFDLADDGIRIGANGFGDDRTVPPGMPDIPLITSIDGRSVATADRFAQVEAVRAWFTAADGGRFAPVR